MHQSQEIEQHGHCRFVGFQPNFHINMMSQMGLFEILQAVRTEQKGILLDFKFCCFGNEDKNNKS